MELWTNGRAHLVATGRGVARLGEQRAIHRFPPPPGLKRDQEPPDLRFMGVADAEGTKVLLGRDEGLAICELAKQGWQVRDLGGPQPLALCSLGKGTAAALVATQDGGRHRVSLRRVKLDLEQGPVLGEAVALPAVRRIDWWKDAIWAPADVPWPEDDDDDFEPDQLAAAGSAEELGKLRLTANAHGIVATSNASGVVAVWDRETLAPRFAIRLPTEDELELHAVATEQGVLAVLTLQGKNSALLHAGPDGKLIAKRHKLGRDPASGLGAPLVLGARAFFTHVQGAEAKTYAVSLPDLEAKVSKELAGDKLHLIAHAAAPDGSCQLVAYGDPAAGPHKWELAIVREGAKKLAVEELIIPDFRPVAAAVGGTAVKRMEGAPALGLAARERAWRTELGQPLTLTFDIPSNGGPSTGLFAEISGDALKQGILKPVDITVGDATTTFEGSGGTWKAELPSVPIEAAFASSNPRTKQVVPQSNTKLSARIRFETVAKGSALLMVRVGPLGASGRTGSAMDGKSVFVG